MCTRSHNKAATNEIATSKHQSKPSNGKQKHPPFNSSQLEVDLQYKVKRVDTIKVISNSMTTKTAIAQVGIKEDEFDACRRPVQRARDCLENTKTISKDMFLSSSAITKKRYNPASPPSPMKKPPPKSVQRRRSAA